MKNQKIIALALGLLIVAGIIVIGLKGFNVDFMLKQHDSIEYTMKEDFEIKDIENICTDVFGDKQFKIRIIELFNDAISINAETITIDEAEKIVTKLNEKYNTVQQTNDAENNEGENTENQTPDSNLDYEIISNPKIKLFSLFKPYILPILLSAILIIIYVGVRFRKLNSIKIVLKLVGLVLVTVLSILSILAIIRFPINTVVIPVIMIIVLLELAIFCARNENKLKSI